MNVLALDVGRKRIGVAASDPLGYTAQGLEVITRQGLHADLQRIKEICQQRQADTIVVGMPRRTDGSYGPEAEEVRRFANSIVAELDVSLEFFDERFSTVSAEQVLVQGNVRREKRRNYVDKVAAVIILQNYLDRKNMHNSLGGE